MPLKNLEPSHPKSRTLLSGVQLAQHARELARLQTVSFDKQTSYPFARYLRKTYKNLNDEYLILTKSMQNQTTSASGSEWIVDNFYLVEEFVHSCHGLLASIGKRKLPILLSGEFSGLPRIYELARELFDHTDCLISEENIDIFIDAYQETTKFTLEELAVFPHFLHLALLENLYVFAKINVTLFKQQKTAWELREDFCSNKLTKKLQTTLENQAVGTIIVLLQSLKEAGTSDSECFQLIADKCHCYHLVERVLHIKSANQISIANIFATLRNLTNLHWNKWFERHSHVHAVLQTDPTGIYGFSEFQTRAQCRHTIQRLDSSGGMKESEIAQSALTFASNQGLQKKEAPLKLQSIVYYLIGDGMFRFESSLEYRAPYRLKIGRWIKRNIIALSFSSLIISIVIALAIPLFYQYWIGSGFWPVAFFMTLILILASEVAMEGLQWLAAQFAKPAELPTLDYQKGIPDNQRTLVCMNTLLSDRTHIQKSVQNLKICARANAQSNIYFALAVDCQPANLKETSEEHVLVTYAAQLIKRLNKSNKTQNRFFLLFRHRSFSHCERQFLGWERKRGKLHQLNSLILGKEPAQMNVEAGDIKILRTMRYVLTLDEDTMVPPGMAVQLIQTIAHPLNEAVFDPAKNVVVEGYGIIQPKITTTLESASRSRFASLFAHLPGLEPYDYTVSNTYQDLFSEGSYIGKAIYDVQAFERALKNRFPQEHILSHDLLEGLFARVGIASSLELLDQFPKNYISFYRRLHRWVRGDWQLLPWLKDEVPSGHMRKIPTPISALGRFKIFDNLRRSLVEPAAFFAFLASFTMLPGSPLFWMILVFFGINFAILISIVERLVIYIFRYSSRQHGISDEKLSIIIIRALVHLSFLPMQVYVILHAISTTLYRLFISRKHLLEWTTASDVERETSSTLLSFVRHMFPGVFLAFISGLCILFFFPDRFLYAAPLLALWLLSPLISFFLAKPIRKRPVQLDAFQHKKLLGIAYDTFLYFNEFTTAETNFLAPDNVQMIPTLKIAMRTSPTNIGFHLQSIISAHDLGIIFLPKVLSQISDIFLTLSKLERFRGHFLNWYDISTLKPLYPRFVSTVDSGNLVGHLISLRSGLKNLANEQILTKHHWHHLQAITEQLEEHTSVPAPRFCDPQTIAQLKDQLDLVSDLMQRLKKAAENSSQMHAFSHNKVQTALIFLDDILRLRGSLQAFFQVAHLEEVTRIHDHLMSLPPTWISLHSACEQILPLLGGDPKTNLGARVLALNHQCKDIYSTIHRLIEQSSEMIQAINFDFLYSEDEKLLSIGYHVDTDMLDTNYYNLLASEASLTSLIAIAKGEVPSKHWFALGRSLVDSSGGMALLSWSGSAFEYLMPALFYRLVPGSLLEKSLSHCVKAQQIHGAKQQLPWGESESAYAAIDINGNYLYRAFGIPELGLKRDLVDNHVVSPYSTFLSLDFDIDGSLENIKRLEKIGARAKYGFYDAIDYTQSRLKQGENAYIVRSFFAHHQGMILCALNNILNQEVLRKRFHQSSLIRSAELLLQERFPTLVQTISLPKRLPSAFEKQPTERSRSIKTPYTCFPSTHLLSNGTLSTMIDNAGSGYMFAASELALTNWTQDAIINNDGYYIFVRDLDTNKFWSLGFQPSRVKPDKYEVNFHPERVTFYRKDFDIELRAEITISPEHNIEVRKFDVTNYSSQNRHLEITSYAEIVLDQLPSFIAHPSFSKLFIESEYRRDSNALIFKRRQREKDEPDLFLMHALVSDIGLKIDQWESSRAHFLGAGNSINNPAALLADGMLSNTTGFTLDPIFSLRTQFTLKAGQSTRFSFVTGMARTRDECEMLLHHYSASNSVERTFQMSFSRSEIDSLYEHMPLGDLHAFQQLTKALFYFLPKSKEGQEATRRNKLHQSDLWRFDISGDYPIVFFRYSDRKQIYLLKRLLTAFNFLGSKQLHFDLFVLNEFIEGYRRDIQDELEQHVLLARSGQSQQNKTGKIVIQNVTQLSEQEIYLLASTAHHIITANEKDPFFSEDVFLAEPNPFSSVWRASEINSKPIEELEYFNGYGGFFDKGKAYRIIPSKQTLSKPWSNVIGTKHIGFLITEKGGGYTWSDNSQTNCLTPRSEDPVRDPCTELIYIRNAHDNSLFSPLPFPRTENGHVIEHHFGFSRFKTKFDQISSELTMTCSITERIKWFSLKLTNDSEQALKFEAFFYLDWVLGTSREKSVPHIFCSYDADSQLLCAQNTYRETFDTRISFIGSSERIVSFTSSRKEFIGRHGDLSSPLMKVHNTISSGIDICGVLQIPLELRSKETKEILFFLGEADTLQDAKELGKHGRSIPEFQDALQKVKAEWHLLTSAIQVKTPDRGFDIMMNGWLLYQTVSCRLLARTSFYQASGAFGFRDQLQDVLALLVVAPNMAREQILLHASRQFLEGDVQHWWMPISGKGVRSRCSDDFLWLPYVLCRYLETTGDTSILDEHIAFIEGPELSPNEKDAYFQPSTSQKSATIYQHCTRALDRSLTVGQHGIPLILSGDWNDGMNRVGLEGKGESVWLGWFLCDILLRFSDVAKSKSDEESAGRYLAHRNMVLHNLEENAWDGSWYRRAFFDDKTPLGSSINEECQIDSITQSWSVIAKGHNLERQKLAMESVFLHLVDEENHLIKLLTPPFDKSALDPGYIKAYPPGVRENGAQYTHAATWVILASAMLGQGQRAYDLFRLINPVHLTSDQEGVRRYQAEPYVLAGDVYSVAPHIGKAGWSWYTGSSGWLFSVGLEAILGLKIRGNIFTVDPCVALAWKHFHITYRVNRVTYAISVNNPNGVEKGVKEIKVAGLLIEDKNIALPSNSDEERTIDIEVLMG